jgi:beta-lactamase regulating signal transducer with metallopeptidase domain
LEEFPELSAPRLRLSNTATHCLVGFYLAALFFGLYRVAAAWRAAQQLVTNSRATMLPPQWQAMFEDSGRRLAAGLPELRESSAIQSPVIVGALRPVLLLPENFIHHTQDEAQAVFYHELAHVCRHDYFVNLICRLAALPVVWHPAIYSVQQRIRRTREMICDEIAAREMQSEIGYAKCLLAMAWRTLGQRDLASSAQAMGLFSDNTLEERMMRLMESKYRMTMRVKLARVAGGATVMIAATAMAALFHVTPTLAQSKAEASPVVVQSQTIGDQAPSAATETVKNPAMAQNTAASPAPPQAKSAATKHETAAHRRKTTDQRQFVIDVGESPALTAEQQAHLQREMDAMQRQVAEATKQLDSPEFKQRMANIQQMQEKLNTIELGKIQQQIDNATAKINSPEFKQHMENLQKQLENGELQRRMEEVNRELKQSEAQRQQSLKALDMSKIQQQIDNATAKINSPEFKQHMENLQKQFENGELQRRMEELDKRMKAAEDRMNKVQR